MASSSFRGYADYMQTESFQQAIEALIALSEQSRCVIMCAEAVPWRCHRSLVGDALLIRGFTVTDIMTEKVSQAHKLTPWAQVNGISITYPPPSDPLPFTSVDDTGNNELAHLVTAIRVVCGHHGDPGQNRRGECRRKFCDGGADHGCGRVYLGIRTYFQAAPELSRTLLQRPGSFWCCPVWQPGLSWLCYFRALCSKDRLRASPRSTSSAWYW